MSKGKDGSILTPALLRDHAKAKQTIAWEQQARMLLKWAADALEAAIKAKDGR